MSEKFFISNDKEKYIQGELLDSQMGLVEDAMPIIDDTNANTSDVINRDVLLQEEFDKRMDSLTDKLGSGIDALNRLISESSGELAEMAREKLFELEAGYIVNITDNQRRNKLLINVVNLAGKSNMALGAASNDDLANAIHGSRDRAIELSDQHLMKTKRLLGEVCTSCVFADGCVVNDTLIDTFVSDGAARRRFRSNLRNHVDELRTCEENLGKSRKKQKNH